jgi:ABC-type branched-subunit amino acid transport system ATPase component
MILEVSNLASGYGRIPVLHGVSFQVNEGECVGIWGHNGMGKTTLLRSIMGYLTANAGTISFSGNDITKLPTHARAQLGIGLVPQGRQIFPGPDRSRKPAHGQRGACRRRRLHHG